MPKIEHVKSWGAIETFLTEARREATRLTESLPPGDARKQAHELEGMIRECIAFSPTVLAKIEGRTK